MKLIFNNFCFPLVVKDITPLISPKLSEAVYSVRSILFIYFNYYWFIFAIKMLDIE